MTRFALLIGCLVLLASLFWGAPAAAHAAPHSLVLLDLRAHDVGAELRLPVSELEVALHEKLLAERAAVVQQEGSAIRAQVVDFLHAQTRDGAPWTVDVGELAYRVDDEVPFVTVQVRLAPPAGASAQSFVLDYDVITHDVVNHTAWVSVRSDFANGVFADRPTVIGVIRYLRKSLLVDRTGGGDWRGFRGTVQLGMQHIAEGTDHLLFLLALLLPAPLLVTAVGVRRPRRWGGYGGLRRSARNLLQIVSAFTLGHSVTLLAGSVGWLRLPGRPVEILIAVSIFVSAVHALRPLFAGREAWVAGGFGLVHGMAFAGALSELHLDPYHLALAVFGFNVGIEAMQLFVVAMLFPWLVLLARTPAYPMVRRTGAAFALLAAAGWIGERAGRVFNPMNVLVHGLAAHGLAVVVALAALALVATMFRSRVSTGDASDDALAEL